MSAPAPGATRLLAHLLGRLTTYCAVAAMLGLSAMLLMHWGIPYGSPTGNQLLKIHPATYLAALSVVFFLIASGPGSIVADLWRAHPGVLVFLGALAILSFQAVVVQHKPVSPLIDTFLLTALIFLALTRLPGVDRARLAAFIHLFFLVNSAIAYGEQLTSFRLTPVIMAGEPVAYEWRSTALLGHPLVNAAQTGIYLVLISGPSGRLLDPRLRTALVLFHLGALSCFGGRTAVVLVGLILGLRGLIAGAKILAGGRFSLRAALGATVLAGALVVAVVGLAQLGAFDRFASRFEDDSGSAHTRLAMLHVFDHLTWEAIVLGPDPADIAAAQRRLDITTAIESFVVAFPAYYGLLVTALFFAGLGALLVEIVRRVGPPAVAPVLFFLVLSAGANGISTKTLDLAIMTTTVLLIGGYRRDPAVAAARNPMVRTPLPQPA